MEPRLLSILGLLVLLNIAYGDDSVSKIGVSKGEQTLISNGTVHLNETSDLREKRTLTPKSKEKLAKIGSDLKTKYEHMKTDISHGRTSSVFSDIKSDLKTKYSLKHDSLSESKSDLKHGSSIISSNHDSSVLKTSKIPAFFNATSKSLSTGATHGFSLFPLFSTHESKDSSKAPSSTAAKKNSKTATKSQAGVESNSEAKPHLIVQPDSLIHEDTDSKAFNPNIITAQQVKETATLRNEINYAVKHNLYVHSSNNGNNDNLNADKPTTTTVPPSIFYPLYTEIYTFWKELVSNKDRLKSGAMKGKGHKKDFILGDVRNSDFSKPDALPKKVIGLSKPSQIEPHDEFDELISDEDALNEKKVSHMMAKIAAQTKNEGIISNTVESYAMGNNVDHETIEMSEMRETLSIASVTEDLNFKIDKHVLEWQTVKRNTREVHALVGLTNTSVVLVFEKRGVYKIQKEIELLSASGCFTTFTYWNQTHKSIDAMVIVSSQRELYFLRINEAMDSMDVVWRWPTIQPISFIKHFVIANTDMLLLLSDAAANIYLFDMNQREFYLRESLSLKVKTNVVAHTQNGHDIFLCFPQNSHAIVYKFISGHFKYFSSIAGDNVKTVSAFEMGGYSYIAIGGNQPKILRYHRGTFVDQTILSQSWGFVEHFLPISARTYRDDLILFVQHRIDFGTHSLPVLEALIWDGEAFDPALSIPCYINNKASDVGLGCLLDHDRELGMIGATVLSHLNRSISIIVPRLEAPSGLFDIELKLLQPKFTYNEHLLDLFSEVYVLLKMREEMLLDAQDVLDELSKNTFDEITVENETVNIETDEVNLGDTVPTEGFYYNGELITSEGAAEFIRLVNETKANIELLHSESREKRSTEPATGLHFNTVEVKNLYARFINDIPIEDFIFIEDNKLQLNGTIVLTQSIDVETAEQPTADVMLGSEQSIKQFIHEAETSTEQITLDDLSFDEINGVTWQRFLEEIVWKDKPSEIEDITITDMLQAEAAVHAENLNGIPFPGDYFINDGIQRNVAFTGRKIFANVLVVDGCDCDSINGVKANQIVTLSKDQTITGTTIFREVEVTETLEVSPKGNISGRHLDDFLANPTLLHINSIDSSCYVQSIEVEGSVFIQKSLNGVDLDQLLNDVVYKHEPNRKVTSFKTFNDISAPNVILSSKLINGIPLDAFVTSNTEQAFNVKSLHGDFFFHNLLLDGLFNGVNVTELDMNSIKLFGEQYTDAELVFENGNFLDITATQLEIRETINKVPVSDFIDVYSNFELFEDVVLDKMTVDHLTVGGEIVSKSGEASINGWHVKNLQEAYLSRKKTQKIVTPVHIETAVIRGPFTANKVNGYDYKEAIAILKNIKTPEQMLKEPTVPIEKVYVNGNVTWTYVNGYEFERIKATAVRLDQPNSLKIPVSFLDPIIIKGNLNVQRLNDVDFELFVADLVQTSDENITIYGKTIFHEDVVVLNSIRATTINDNPAERLLNAHYKERILNPIHVNGDVSVSSLNVDGKFNGISSNDLSAYSFDEQTQTYILHKNVLFKHPISIYNLHLSGGFNKVSDVKSFIKSVVRKDRPALITGRKTFYDRIHFENDIHIYDYNGVDVPNFLSNVILFDQYSPADIYSNVVFMDPVSVYNLQVQKDLIVSKINNCSVIDWHTNAIRTDEPFTFNGRIVFDSGTFEGNNIITKTLNGYPMDQILTLNTPQTFGEVHFGDVESRIPITTEGLVSGFNLPNERKNTLMVYGEQYITIPTTFQSIRVLKELLTAGPINGIDLRLAALTDGDIYLEPPLSFESVSVNNLYTREFISGVNIDKWMDNSFRYWSQQPQVVTGNWHIKTGYIDSMYSSLGVNGMDISTYQQQLYQQSQQTENNFKRKCEHVQSLIDDTQKSVLFLSNFENSFKISVKSQINAIYFFDAVQRNYLLVSAACETGIYLWDESNKKYAEVFHGNTGIVNEWIHVLDLQNQLYLVSNNDGTGSSLGCLHSGANIWQFNHDSQQISRIQQFGVDGEFRSLQRKPNSHAYFYALSNRNNRMIEFDTRGLEVAQFEVGDSRTPTTENLRFVPVGANLGLALSDGDSLALLSTFDCATRNPRCATVAAQEKFASWLAFRHTNRALFEQSVSNLRKTFAEFKEAINARKFGARSEASVTSNGQQQSGESMPEKTISNLTQLTVEEENRMINEMDEDVSTLVPKLINELERNLNALSDAENGTAANSTDNAMVGDLKGKLLVDIIDEADKLIEKNRKKHRKGEYENDYEVEGQWNKNGNSSNATTNAIESLAQNSTNQNDTIVGGGKLIVDLMDKVDKLIDKNREKHKKYEYEDGEYEEVYELTSNHTEADGRLNGSSITNSNSTSNRIDQQVQLIGFMRLENALVHAIEVATDAVAGRHHDDDDDGDIFHRHHNGLFSLLHMQRNVTSSNETSKDESSSNETGSVGHILRLIDEAENITKAHKESVQQEKDDPVVGIDQFGDLLYKLTPLADKIADKIVDEIRRRKYEDHYQEQYDEYGYVGGVDKSSNITKTRDDSKYRHISIKKVGGLKESKISGFFKKIGRALVKVYVAGKDKLIEAKDLFYDAKTLYIVYGENHFEDNANDNKSYGAPAEASPIPKPTELPDMDIRHSEIKTDINTKKNVKSKTFASKKFIENELQAHQDDLSTLRKAMPDADEMIATYTVLMVNAFKGENTTDPITQSVWNKLGNAVAKAFEDPKSDERKGDKIDKSTTPNDQLYNKTVIEAAKTMLILDIINRLEEIAVEKEMLDRLEEITAETEKESKSEHTNSTVKQNNTNGPTVGTESFVNLFEKFTPLVDTLSDQMVDEIHRQRALGKYQHTYEYEYVGAPNLNVIGHQNATMHEIFQKLNDFKSTEKSKLKLDLLGQMHSDKMRIVEPQRHNQLETTIVSIPNPFLPAKHKGEIVAITVGDDHKTFIAVSSIAENVIKDNHDQIQIFEDVVDGRLFQTIACFKPRSLTTFNVNMDTVLAFIQGDAEIRTFIFRGIQGFVEFTSFKLPSPVKRMVHTEIISAHFACPENYLALVVGNEVQFLKAVTIGDCKINANLQCQP